jgi:hypothetical protein
LGAVDPRWILEGTTEGHEKSASINRRTLKAIIDSAYGLDPEDKSPEARATRTKSLKDLEGIAFVGKVGIEKGKPRGNGEFYDDKNILAGVITRDRKDWHAVEQSTPPVNSGGAQASLPVDTAPPVTRPGWAQV